jgi:hypothetical protein
MTVGAARTGAGVRKPPMEETAMGERRTGTACLALQLQFFLEMGPARVGLMSPAPGGPSK